MRQSTETEFGWGAGSVVTMLVVVVCLVFLPLGMGPVQPPPIYILLIFPVLLAAILIFLSQASK